MYFHKTKSSIKSAIEYNMADQDHTKKDRKHKPIFMQGDTEKILKMEKIAKEFGIKNTHSSLTIAFRDNEFSELRNPDGSFNEEILKEKMQPIIDGFRQTWFPGMKEGVNFLDHWSIHTDKGNVELNCAFLKMELTTGRAFNPFQPGKLNQDMRDYYVDLLNEELGFDRIVRNPFAIKHNDMEMKDIKNPSEVATYQKEVVKPKKDEIQNYLSDLVIKGKINSREDMIKTLQKNGEVKFLDKENEKNKYNYISFVPEGLDKPIRLEGLMFQKNADFDLLREQHLENKNNFRLSEKEINQKSEKLKTHVDIQKNKNKSMLQSKIKSVKKNSSRVYLSKSMSMEKKNRMKLKQAQNKNKEQELKRTIEDHKKKDQKDADGGGKQPQPQQQSAQGDGGQTQKQLQKELEMKKLKDESNAAKSEIKEEQKASKIENDTEKINANNQKNQSKDENKSSNKDSDFKMPSHSGNGSSAVIQSQINGLLSQSNALGLQIASLQNQIASLNPFKLSHMKKIEEIKAKINELEQKKLELAAKIEQLGDSLAQAKRDEMNKGNNFTPTGFKPKR